MPSDGAPICAASGSPIEPVLCDQSGRTPNAVAARIRPPETPGLLIIITESAFASRSFWTYGEKSVVAPGSTNDAATLRPATRAAFRASFAFVAALGTSW